MGRRIRRRWLLAVPVAVIVLVPAFLLAAQRPSGASSTLLTIFRAGVEVARAPAVFAPAVDGQILANGDHVRTDATGHALISFFDGSTLEIEPSTVVQVVDASASSSGAIAIQLQQALGRTWASVHGLTRADSKFEIRTPSSVASVRGTGFLTEVLPSGETSVRTTDGTVAVTAQGQTVLVTAGLVTTVRPNAPPTTPAPAAAPSNRLRFGMHSPAYLAIVDPVGRTCGITMPGPLVTRHIPGCVATPPGVEPQLIDVPDAPAGTYRTLIVAIDPGGPFTLTATGIDGGGDTVFDFAMAGVGRPGAVFGSALTVETLPDGRLSASGLAPLVALRAPSPSPPAGPTDAAADAPRAATPQPTSSTAPLSAPPSSPGAATATPTPAATATSTPTTTTPPPSASPSPAPSPSPGATPTPTAAPATTTAPTPAPTAPPDPTPTAAPTPTSAPTPTPAPTPSPGCIPSRGQPTKCDRDLRGP